MRKKIQVRRARKSFRKNTFGGRRPRINSFGAVVPYDSVKDNNLSYTFDGKTYVFKLSDLRNTLIPLISGNQEVFKKSKETNYADFVVDQNINPAIITDEIVKNTLFKNVVINNQKAFSPSIGADHWKYNLPPSTKVVELGKSNFLKALQAWLQLDENERAKKKYVILNHEGALEFSRLSDDPDEESRLRRNSEVYKNNLIDEIKRISGDENIILHMYDLQNQLDNTKKSLNLVISEIKKIRPDENVENLNIKEAEKKLEQLRNTSDINASIKSVEDELKNYYDLPNFADENENYEAKLENRNKKLEEAKKSVSDIKDKITILLQNLTNIDQPSGERGQTAVDDYDNPSIRNLNNLKGKYESLLNVAYDLYNEKNNSLKTDYNVNGEGEVNEENVMQKLGKVILKIRSLQREKEEQERLQKEKEEADLQKQKEEQERLQKEKEEQERLQKEKEEQERLQKEKEERLENNRKNQLNMLEDGLRKLYKNIPNVDDTISTTAEKIKIREKQVQTAGELKNSLLSEIRQIDYSGIKDPEFNNIQLPNGINNLDGLQIEDLEEIKNKLDESFSDIINKYYREIEQYKTTVPRLISLKIKTPSQKKQIYDDLVIILTDAKREFETKHQELRELIKSANDLSYTKQQSNVVYDPKEKKIEKLDKLIQDEKQFIQETTNKINEIKEKFENYKITDYEVNYFEDWLEKNKLLEDILFNLKTLNGTSLKFKESYDFKDLQALAERINETNKFFIGKNLTKFTDLPDDAEDYLKKLVNVQQNLQRFPKNVELPITSSIEEFILNTSQAQMIEGELKKLQINDYPPTNSEVSFSDYVKEFKTIQKLVEKLDIGINEYASIDVSFTTSKSKENFMDELQNIYGVTQNLKDKIYPSKDKLTRDELLNEYNTYKKLIADIDIYNKDKPDKFKVNLPTKAETVVALVDSITNEMKRKTEEYQNFLEATRGIEVIQTNLNEVSTKYKNLMGIRGDDYTEFLTNLRNSHEVRTRVYELTQQFVNDIDRLLQRFVTKGNNVSIELGIDNFIKAEKVRKEIEPWLTYEAIQNGIIGTRTITNKFGSRANVPKPSIVQFNSLKEFIEQNKANQLYYDIIRTKVLTIVSLTSIIFTYVIVPGKNTSADNFIVECVNQRGTVAHEIVLEGYDLPFITFMNPSDAYQFERLVGDSGAGMYWVDLVMRVNSGTKLFKNPGFYFKKFTTPNILNKFFDYFDQIAGDYEDISIDTSDDENRVTGFFKWFFRFGK